MQNNSPIGFFDSGVGGLSVYARFKKELPYENTLYYGDLKNLPYGNKTKEELIGFARNILNFFQTKEVKAVVIACNTSSALAYDSIKNDYDFDIFPIIQSCAKVISEMNIKKIGVFATVGTVSSKAYSKEIQKHNSSIEVNEIACPHWVSFVENGNIDSPETISDIKTLINQMNKFTPDKIILGCTHYPYLLESLKEFAPENLFIDPSEIFVEYLKNNIKLNESKKIGTEKFFVSANPEAFVKNAKIFYDVKNLPTLIL